MTNSKQDAQSVGEPSLRIVASEGYIPLTVVVAVDPIETSTLYVRAVQITTILAPPAGAQFNTEVGGPPGSNIGLAHQQDMVGVLETPEEIFDLLERSAVMRR